MKMSDCFFEEKDWRACKDEVRFPFSRWRVAWAVRTYHFSACFLILSLGVTRLTLSLA
jgi:hypothetical protein